jgi:hypothetical protein
MNNTNTNFTFTYSFSDVSEVVTSLTGAANAAQSYFESCEYNDTDEHTIQYWFAAAYAAVMVLQRNPAVVDWLLATDKADDSRCYWFLNFTSGVPYAIPPVLLEHRKARAAGKYL